MYFTSGSDRAFEQLMQQRPGADHFDSGDTGAPEDCGDCRFYRPDWKYQFCVYAECPYQPGKLTALDAVLFQVKGVDDEMAVFCVEKNRGYGTLGRTDICGLPLDVLSRSETPGQVWDRQKFRVTVYGSDGKELTGVMRTSEGELVEISNGGRIESLHPLGDMRTWLSQTYCPQGYASADSVVSLTKLPQGEMGPYTFEVEAYSTSGGWGEVLWSGTLTLDTPLAVDATQASREIGMGTVSALVGEDGRGVAFHAVLAPQYAEAGDRLCQLVVPEVWFIDESGNRHQSYLRRYTRPEDYMPELRMAAEPAGEIVAIEVDCVEYSIIHGDGREQSYPVYDDLNWVIELPR